MLNQNYAPFKVADKNAERLDSKECTYLTCIFQAQSPAPNMVLGALPGVIHDTEHRVKP